jgi:hypothetical protein
MFPAPPIITRPGFSLSLDGETILHDVFNSAARAELWINADGTVDEGIDSVFSQIDSATDWVRPEHFSTSLPWYIRWNFISGDAVTTTPIAEDTWVLMDGVSNYTWTNFASAGNLTTSSIQVSIHWNNTDTFDTETETGSYIITADGRAL